MRILVVGAGAIGGYFGGRLLEAGQDVIFLVRPRRAAELASHGLVIKSSAGDFTRAAPPTITVDKLDRPFDLILLSCKAYDLDGAIESFAPAVGPGTAILPLLNGMVHLDRLDARFGAERVLGGECIIAATVGENGTILHLNAEHELTFGERGGGISDRVRAIIAAMAGAKFKSRASEQILQEMWDKWVFLATLAASTCITRAAIGDIIAAPQGKEFVLGLLDECSAIAKAADHPPRDAFLARCRVFLTTEGSTLTASMLRDIEKNAPIEADHIIGNLLRRGGSRALPLLGLAYTSLKAYEARRHRLASSR